MANILSATPTRDLERNHPGAFAHWHSRRRRAGAVANFPVMRSVERIIDLYNADAPLRRHPLFLGLVSTPASWSWNSARCSGARWQCAGRVDQLRAPGDATSCELPGGEPIVVVRGNDEVVRGFFNVCRHHARGRHDEPKAPRRQFSCPYHGWTYSLEGELKGTPDFTGVCDFDRSANGLVPLDCAAGRSGCSSSSTRAALAR